MSFLRWFAASVAATVSGFAAVGFLAYGLFSDIKGDGQGPGVRWFVLAAGSVLTGMAACAWLLPTRRPCGVLAVLGSAAVWFVLLGGLNIS